MGVCTPIGEHMNVWGCTNILGMYRCRGIMTSPKNKTCLPLRTVGKKTLFKVKFLHLRNWKMIREPPDHTGNEHTPDIPIGGSGQDLQKNKMANQHNPTKIIDGCQVIIEISTDKKQL